MTGFGRAYERLDLAKVHRAALRGPADLRAFLGCLATRTPR